MRITSPAFENATPIPKKYTQFGENINPPLHFEDIPKEAKSLVLIVDDPDVPEIAGVPVWDHWIVFNISPIITDIPENWIVQGMRGAGTRGLLDYSGPKPPDREHRYFFKLYALDIMLGLSEGTIKKDIEQAMNGHILAQAELIGLCAPE